MRRKPPPPFTRSELKALMIGVLLLTFGLRLLLALTVQRTIWGDEPYYLWLSDNFLSEGVYSFYHDIPDILHPPGYPLLIGLTSFFFRSAIAGSLFWFVVAGTATLVPLFLLGREIYGELTAILACLLYAVSPAMLSGTLFGETLAGPPYLFFVLSGIYFFFKAQTRDWKWDPPLTALCFGFAYLIKTQGGLFFLLFLILGIFRLRSREEIDWRKMGGRLISYMLVFVILTGPYIVFLHRSLQAFGAETTWTLSGGASRSHALAQAQLNEDRVRYDLEAWGLDWRKQEVRLFSSDVETIPILTQFFENPGQYFADIWKNIHRTSDILQTSSFFGQALLFLIVLGLLGRPWDRFRVKHELLLFLALLPFCGSWIFLTTRQSLYAALPILFLWAAQGLAHLERWFSRTVDNLKIIPYYTGTQAWIKSAALGVLILFLVIVNVQSYVHPYESGVYNLRTVARWIKNNTAPNSTVMSRQPEIAFHANRVWVAFPHAPYPECLRYAKARGADYWVFEGDVIRSERAHMLPVLEGRIGQGEIEEVFRIEIPPSKIYAIYKILP